MKLGDLIEEGVITEAKMVWRKSGNKVTRGVRCTSGPRKGRVVSNASQCGKPMDLKKRMTLKKTKAKMGKRMARKAKKTKKFNPASRRIKALNKRS